MKSKQAKPAETPKPFVSRCTGRIPLPEDPDAPWPPELLEKLFPQANRSAWNDVVALTYEQHNAEPADGVKEA